MRMPTALAAIAAVAVSLAHAQSPAVSAPTGQKTLAATLNVYAFPSAGQAPSKQAVDETECYNWAVQNTGNDPFQIAKNTQNAQQQAAQQQQQVRQANAGAGAKGAVGGAAAGALIGGIASNDAGKGAAIGAGVGLLTMRARAREREQQSAQQANQQVQSATQTAAQQLDAFKKAFSVCLEAHQYLVKY